MTREKAKLVLDSLSTWVGQERLITDEIVEAIKALSKPSLPSNLDDYARDASLTTAQQIQAYTNEPMTEYGFNLIREMLEEAIHRGAKWMAGQGETVDGFISIKGKRSLISVLSHLNDFKYGDKVIVQIRKK